MLIVSKIRSRRQKEAEQRLIEAEVAKRVSELVEKRVAEELEKRKDEIEIEVKRRVEEAKVQMELKLIEDFERKRLDELKRQKDKEVCFKWLYHGLFTYSLDFY